jgi:hypothetical protein
MKCHYLVSIHLPDYVLNHPDATEDGCRYGMADALRDLIPTITPSISSDTWWNVQVVKNAGEASEVYLMHERITSTPEAERIAAAQRYDPNQPTVRRAGEHLYDEAPDRPVVYRFVTDSQLSLFKTAVHLAQFLWLIVKARTAPRNKP